MSVGEWVKGKVVDICIDLMFQFYHASLLPLGGQIFISISILELFR